jgi:predicted short-subunit dehydrogenase-like oxidoreductase (DUF2520 family)
VPPPVLVQAAAPRELVSVTSSPTPIVSRVRAAGDVATVDEVMVHVGAVVEQGGVTASGGRFGCAWAAVWALLESQMRSGV